MKGTKCLQAFILGLICLLYTLGSGGADGPPSPKHRDKVRVVKDVRGVYHILYLMSQRSRKIPDEATVRVLGFDPAQVAVVQDNDLLSYVDTYSVPVPSLADETKKSLITKHIEKISILSPSFFWKEMYLLPWVLNPAITKWQKRFFVTWRNGVYNQPIHFGWLEFEDGEYYISETSRHWGVGNPKIVSVQSEGFNELAEDPRVIPRSDGSLMVQYTSKQSLFSPPKQTFMHILPPKYKGMIKNVGVFDNKNPENATTTNSVLLDGHFMNAGQKNWVAITKGDNVYFIENINPLHVMVAYDTTSKNIGMLATVFSGTKVDLPWSSDYGSYIRGGTPAVYLEKENLYLAFFHTVAYIIAPKMRTYFMGAIAFCPQLPFHMHAMSPYPILKEALYEGPGVQQDIDHVVFPIGLVVDDDKEHVLLSFGSNDRGGYINKLHIKELLDTMDVVNAC